MSRSKTTDEKDDSIPTPEWVVAGIGLLLVCLALGFLTYKAFSIDDGEPELSFTVESIVAQDGGSLVLARVNNTGGKTLTGLQILGNAGNDTHVVEIDFLPARSSRTFGMFFQSVLEETAIKFTPGGYQEP